MNMLLCAITTRASTTQRCVRELTYIEKLCPNSRLGLKNNKTLMEFVVGLPTTRRDRPSQLISKRVHQLIDMGVD